MTMFLLLVGIPTLISAAVVLYVAFATERRHPPHDRRTAQRDLPGRRRSDRH